jgi:hypothetical protein
MPTFVLFQIFYVIMSCYLAFFLLAKKKSFFPFKFIQHLEETKRKDEEEIILY